MTELDTFTHKFPGKLWEDVSPQLAAQPVIVSGYHHGSHRQLVRQHVPARVQAIIVPTVRPISYLRTAVELAAHLDCALIVLCSRQAKAEEALRLGQAAEVETVAIDFTDALAELLLPQFDTTDLLVDSRFHHRVDTSGKRNLGLLLARAVGWDRIVFLDDDLYLPRPTDLQEAARLLDYHDLVSLAVGGYPDNSVVCFAHRASGGFQDTFIGGAALAVGRKSMYSFFPKIYNEDWFFLLEDKRLKSVAVTGTAFQTPYDPYINDWRARSEELGDCLAEGILALLDQGRHVQDADADYWRGFLARRQLFIDEIVDRVRLLDNDAQERQRMLNALAAAKGRTRSIKPNLCVRYLRAWQSDRVRWRKHVQQFEYSVSDELAKPRSLEKTMSDLGLFNFGSYAPPQQRRP